MPRANAAPSADQLRSLAADAHAGFPSRKGGEKNVRARAALAKCLWDRRGQRRLPTQLELDRALMGVGPKDLEWICELSPLGPLYLLPTRSFIRALANTIGELQVTRVVEVAAGDGFLSRALQKQAPSLQVIATDSGHWRNPAARMKPEEKRALSHTSVPGLSLGHDVRRIEAVRAVRELAPELVLASWLPPGSLLDRLIKSNVRYVLEIGAGGGVTASIKSWRFAHEFCEGAIEKAARCRLDLRPAQKLHSRITLYYGAAHPDYFEDKQAVRTWLRHLA